MYAGRFLPVALFLAASLAGGEELRMSVDFPTSIFF
jgi:hypothetical protein